MSDAQTEIHKPAHGGISARCCIYRSPTGLWYFYSEDWRGMMLVGHDLPELLGKINGAGKELLAAMQDWHARTPYTEEKQLHQMKVYEQFFGNQP